MPIKIKSYYLKMDELRAAKIVFSAEVGFK
jgi:hypothetical protein